MSKESRKEWLGHISHIIDGEEKIPSAIIERDRKRLKKLLSQTIWQSKVQK